MSVPYYGDFPTNHTGVVIPFNAFTSNDPSASATVTDFASTDVYIHKNGSLTQRSSAAGIAIDIDVDGITGGHWITIDLSDNTDAGFYAAGGEYSVRIEGVTIDAATVNAFVGAFSIERAGGVLALLKAGTAKVDVEHIKTQDVTCGAGVTVGVYVGGASAAALASEVTSARMGALTDLIDGGRLDLLIDAIKACTDLVTAARMGALTDLVDGGRLDLLIDAIKACTDLVTAARMGALTDLVDGGRLDLLIDAIKACTDLVTAARMGALTDLVDGGRLDLLIDAILLDTGTTLQAELDAIEAAVITNAAGVDIAADIIALKAVADAVLVDTGTTLQGELDAIEAAVITNAAGADVAADIIALKVVADAVQAKTDLLNYTGAGASAKVKSDLKAINGTAVAGDGGATPWGP